MPVDNPAVGLTVQAAEHRTNYFDLGSGEPVVLLHGSGPGVSSYWNWHDVMEPLADHCRVLAVDIAGYGYTEFVPDAAYNIKVWVRHLVAFLDALDLRSATLVGNSFGGALALATTVKHPERVNRLVLMGTPAGEFERTSNLADGWRYEPSLENMRTALEKLPYDPAVVTDDLVRARHEASIRPGAEEAYRKLLPEPKEGSDVVRGVPEALVRAIEQPALILHGREDGSIPVDVGYNLFRWLPNVEAHLFGKTGHWVQAERSQTFVDLIVDFLGRHPAQPAGDDPGAA